MHKATTVRPPPKSFDEIAERTALVSEKAFSNTRISAPCAEKPESEI